ncbi:LacI family DNA-binding transcriptional regulator [Actinomadura barringtoniae]|uniref:LacI family DNA-binding transcriptional regulator n=1 Tax=Actinomadura barringtoniae TaxID=1427535 RepID=A0A939PG47_9ACTN|nr:LacI family DNA-binding transcriptional regulator [Actinomadura barringtoniae]MBO2447886.1 LacI family DNA-binding transcriptional regulator [Actinomadura barringtoniae]
MATMADVARQARVSISTVSHVINGTRYVSDETRQRVLTAVEDTGYIHNTVARSLVTSSTKSIGLAISAISNFYFADLVAALESQVRLAGYTLLLTDTHDDAEEELKVVQALHQRRVDGILLATEAHGPGSPALRYLEELSIPTVLVDRCASPRFDQVGTENIESSAHLVLHLAQLGHRRIGMVSGRAGLVTSAERITGYRIGLKRAGLPPDPELIASGASNAHNAEAAIARLLTLPDPPTALFVANNHMTIGVMRALDKRGVHVPDDLALSVFDDFEWASIFRPRLTSIAQPIRQIAATAMDLLAERITEPDQPPRAVRLKPRFMHRESCGCLR